MPLTITTNIRGRLKKVPFLRSSYINLWTMTHYIRFRLKVNDECRLTDRWDFSTPKERARQRDALAVAKAIVGERSLGDVLEVGCHSGQFTQQLAAESDTVIACDVSDDYCEAARARCKAEKNVTVYTINILKDEVPGRFDVAFVMGVLCFFKGNRRLMTVAGKLDNVLREGGLLVLQEMRLPPEVEDKPWSRWLREGPVHLFDFIVRKTRFKLLSQTVRQDYVIGVFQKSPEYAHRASWKSFVPDVARRLRGKIAVFESLKNLPSAQRFALTQALAPAVARSLISVEGLNQLRELAALSDSEKIPGDFVECGTYRGGSALVLGQSVRGSALRRHLWLFDSFQGLPASGENDGPAAAQMGAGRLSADKEDLRNFLLHHDVPADKITITPGWFNETLHGASIQCIALLHIDADWYSSVKQCLQDFYHLVSPGGVIVFDDYDEWPGCKAAVDEFLSDQGPSIVLHGGSGVPYYIRKPG